MHRDLSCSAHRAVDAWSPAENPSTRLFLFFFFLKVEGIRWSHSVAQHWAFIYLAVLTRFTCSEKKKEAQMQIHILLVNMVPVFVLWSVDQPRLGRIPLGCVLSEAVPISSLLKEVPA